MKQEKTKSRIPMGTHLWLHAGLWEAVHQVLHWVLVITQGVHKVLQESTKGGKWKWNEFRNL